MFLNSSPLSSSWMKSCTVPCLPVTLSHVARSLTSIFARSTSQLLTCDTRPPALTCLPRCFRQLTLELTPSTELFTADFRAFGTNGPIDISDRQYYHGHVAGQANRSAVHFRVADDGSCHGSIQTDDEQYVYPACHCSLVTPFRHCCAITSTSANPLLLRYELEPAAWHFETPPAGFNHVMHRLSDHANSHLPNLNSCETITAPQPEGESTRQRRAAQPFDSSRRACGVALVADKLFFDSVGAEDEQITIDKMVASFNVRSGGI